MRGCEKCRVTVDISTPLLDSFVDGNNRAVDAWRFSHRRLFRQQLVSSRMFASLRQLSSSRCRFSMCPRARSIEHAVINPLRPYQSVRPNTIDAERYHKRRGLHQAKRVSHQNRFCANTTHSSVNSSFIFSRQAFATDRAGLPRDELSSCLSQPIAFWRHVEHARCECFELSLNQRRHVLPLYHFPVSSPRRPQSNST